MSEYCVYKHTGPNGKVYIGITGMIPQKRWANGSGYRGNPHFYNAIKKYGWDNFHHEVLIYGLPREEAIIKEIELIKYHNSHLSQYGYNVSLGGHLLSLRTLQEMSANVKKQWERDPARKETMSKAVASLWRDGDYKSKVSISMKLAANTPRSKAVHSEIMKKRWENQQLKEKVVSKITEMRNTPESKAITSRRTKEMWHNKDFYFEQWGHPMAVRCIDSEEVFESAGSASEAKQLRRQEITNCCSGFRGRVTCGGYHWEWATGETP